MKAWRGAISRAVPFAGAGFCGRERATRRDETGKKAPSETPEGRRISRRADLLLEGEAR